MVFVSSLTELIFYLKYNVQLGTIDVGF